MVRGLGIMQCPYYAQSSDKLFGLAEEKIRDSNETGAGFGMGKNTHR
jgi:hypothetical protein